MASTVRPETLPRVPGDVIGDAVTITVPVDGFEKVVRLVTAGHASHLGFGFETVDDLQLAIELVLRSIPVRDENATVRMTSDERSLTVEVGPVGTLTLDPQQLRPMDGANVELGASLSKLVDDVELRAGEGPSVVLTKQLPAPAA